MAQTNYLYKIQQQCTRWYGDWRIEYYDNSSQLRSSLTVPSEASGDIRTASIVLHDFQASGEFQDSMDFRIVAAGDNDVAIALVRLIK